ncbi:hypothetical protein PAJ34TS1_56280 [Paenibacillus azoreducens]|uniref:Uncharacterized protein n=1 Tax=Paenibacillus azoreducens TaxID=116718 RepID=A0A919YCK3_9BACL|nr:hypothetical protein J34TS1_19930 [Paenibacillus azoreducens]
MERELRAPCLVMRGLMFSDVPGGGGTLHYFCYISNSQGKLAKQLLPRCWESASHVKRKNVAKVHPFQAFSSVECKNVAKVHPFDHEKSVYV